MGNEKELHPVRERVRIYDYISTWIVILVIALILRIILAYSSVIPAGTALHAFTNEASYFILFGAGSMLLPLVIGAILGAEIGTRSKNSYAALRSGAINGIYTATIYTIAIIALYEIMLYILPQIGLNPYALFYTMLAPQIIILLVIIEVFSILANAKKSTSI